MNIQNIMKKAESFYYAKNYDEAMSLCNKILAKKPKILKARQLLAICYQELNKQDLALSEFKTALNYHPNDAFLLNNIGNYYLGIQKYKTAINYLQKAIEVDSMFAPAYSNLGVCQQEIGMFEQAESNYKKALLYEVNTDRNDSYLAEFNQNLGSLYIELGEFELANQYLTKSLEINPQQGGIYFHILSLMMYQHRYQDALEVADMGILSQNLSDIQLCELLVGKATLFWLFDNVEEAYQAISLSEGVYTDNTNYSNITNLTTFHRYLKLLIEYKIKNPEFYQTQASQEIYFISESHGFAPAGATIQYKDELHSIKSLFIRGAKVFHIGKAEQNKYKVSLLKIFDGLEAKSKIVLGFGEIDCRSNEGIINYCLKTEESYQKVIEKTVNQYINLVTSEAQKKHHELIIYGVPAPHPSVVAAMENLEHQELFKNIVEYFNGYMRKTCVDKNIEFLDVYHLTNDNKASNLKYNIDVYHMLPHTIIELFKELA